MESLSGPLHSRKLSNGNGFSSMNNVYEGLFSGQKKFGLARTEDYVEIFGSSHGASSIPVLDLSGLDDPNGSSNLKSSKPDYSNIFGGFRDEDDGAVSHEELFGRVNGVKNSPEKARVISARRQLSEDSEDLFDPSNQSDNTLKQFNMSYHKATQKSKDGLNGTTHVAQLQAVPGYTCFIDEIKMASSLKPEAGTQKSSAVNGFHPKNDGRPEVKNCKTGYKQTSGSAVKSKSRYSRGESFSDDKLFKAYEINVESQPSKLPSPSFMPPNSENNQAHSNGPVSLNSGEPEIDVSGSDEELDVNSAAAASVAALKKAIEKAQESICIAKESVGRRKEGLRSFSNKSFKDSLKVKEREIIDKNVEVKRGRVDAGSEVFDLMERKNVHPDFKDGDKLLVARKVVDEMHGKISESARKHEMLWSVPEPKENERVPVSREVRDETIGRYPESIEKLKASTQSFEQVTLEKGSTVKSAFEPPFSGNNVLESAEFHESKSEVRVIDETLEEQGFVKKSEEVENSCILDEGRENGMPSSKQKEQEVLGKPYGFFKLVNFVKNFRGFVETMEDDKNVSNKLKDDNNYKVRVNEVNNSFEDENRRNDSREMMENEQIDHNYEKKLDQPSEKFEIGKEQEEVLEESIEKAENDNEIRKVSHHSVNENILKKVTEWVEIEPKKPDVSNESEEEDTHKKEAIEKWLDEVNEMEINEKAQTFVHDMEVSLQDDNQKGEETEKFSEERDATDEKDSDGTLKEKREWAGDDEVVTEDYLYKEKETTVSGTDGNVENREIEMSQKVDYEEIFARDFDGFNHDTSNIAVENQDTCEVKVNDNKVKAGQVENDSSRRPEVREEEAEVVEVSNRVQKYEIFEAATRTSTEDNEREFEAKDVHDAFSFNQYEGKYGLADKEEMKIGLREGKSEFTANGAEEAVSNENFEAAARTSTEDNEREIEVKNVHEAFSYNQYEGKYGLADKEEMKIGLTIGKSEFTADVDEEAVSNEAVKIEKLIKEEVKTAFPQEGRNLFPKRAHWDLERSRLPSIPKEKEQTVEIKDEFKRSQYREKSENLFNTMEDKKDEVKKVEEKKQLKDLDEATKKQREWEKDRLVVERAIREARERAFTEARERAERAAVERATAEVRQRVLAEAREKIERVSTGNTTKKLSSEKASSEAKIRAERAAVERAMAEARERALEKGMSQKTSTSERFVAEKFSGASRDAGIRPSSSADLHGSSGTNSESAQRSKARLERHNRIMERAAKALAEKENRDLLAQREQAERNRLSETLDAEIKRWSSGKQGNLRALLSTLQYILGSNSGWQPVTLTEIITTSAVKKAYRKATLVVHPDKVQQRGASIQQKYICEKVFDLLKAAWNKFNSEER